MEEENESTTGFDVEADPSSLTEFLIAAGQTALASNFEPSVLKKSQRNWVPHFVKSMFVMTESKDRYLYNNEEQLDKVKELANARLERKFEREDKKRHEEIAKMQREPGRFNQAAQAARAAEVEQQEEARRAQRANAARLAERRFLQRYLPKIATDFSQYFEVLVGDELQQVVEEITLDAISYTCSYFANHHKHIQRTVKSAHEIQREQQLMEAGELAVKDNQGVSAYA